MSRTLFSGWSNGHRTGQCRGGAVQEAERSLGRAQERGFGKVEIQVSASESSK